LGVVTFLSIFLALFKRDMHLLQQSDWGDYLLGSRHMSFAKDGMRHKDQHSSSHTDWKLVKDMVETPSHIFFFLSSTSTVIFVPKRIFTNEQDQDHFIAATKAWMRAAQASDA
ncbi:MAG: YcxB family protein, partial [Bdellovibrionales bacterium]|nr:YcxB family protein [Bdellovibrionales bacterium]